MYQESFFPTIKEQFKIKKFKMILGVLFLFLLKEFAVVIYLNGDVSFVADGYSEANTVRGAYYYAQEGFSKAAGLPDLCYSKLHDGSGFRGKNKGECKRNPDGSYIYTHYPPGSEYLATPLMKIFGPKMFLLRTQPILFNFSVAIIFFSFIFTILPVGHAFIASLVLLFPPMFHNYWHGLHHQGYAFSLLLLQIVTLSYFWSHKSKKIFFYLLLAFLGFVQGWMTFDYAFLATFFTLPAFFYFRTKLQLKWSDWFITTFFSGLGFSAAHLIHFYQVVLYYGTFDEAFNDLFHSAKYRFDNLGKTNHKITSARDLNPFSVAKDFLWRVAGRGKYTAVNLINYVWIVLGLYFVKKIEFRVKNYKFEFSISKNDCYSLLSAVLVASLWSLVMRQHAYIHGFIARHYYLVYLFCTLVLFKSSKRVDHRVQE
jgi:hypothetical protein